MRGTILGATESAIGGVVLPYGDSSPPPAAPAWSIAGATQIAEGATGSYTVSYGDASLVPGETATIEVATAAGMLAWPDATADADYTALSSVLTFTGGGATAKTVAVSTIEDAESEGTEDFRVTIGGQSVGTLTASAVDTAIEDDDSVALLLDLVPGAVQAYSMRKLRAEYAGNCIRLRRSSDNAESDFGFDGNDLDTTAIATWLGGATGHVVTWYDQSGNGHDVTNAIAATQPEYDEVGLNGLPCISFVRTNNDQLAGSAFAASTDLTIAAVVVATTDTTVRQIASGAPGTNFGEFKSGTVQMFGGHNDVQVIHTVASDTTVAHLAMFARTGSIGELFQNGNSLGTGSVGAGAVSYVAIGRSVANLNSWDGEISEVVVWSAYLDATDRETSESEINLYWSLWG